MTRFFQVDVFADAPYQGNPLAVFPDAGNLSGPQMQAIAREMNLSESTFVTSTTADSYDVRIFTPGEELPFAGHPTLGTAWLLARLDLLSATSVVQRSPAGETPVTLDGDTAWFERTGRADDDLEDRDTSATRKVADALGTSPDVIGLEARELGRPGRLMPAYADVGIRHLIAPVRDVSALSALQPDIRAMSGLGTLGIYAITAIRAGEIRARGFFGAIGIDEDPGTGSAAAALGIYLTARIGPIDLRVIQGVEIGRPCHIDVKATEDGVRVGGRCELVLTGALEVVPHDG